MQFSQTLDLGIRGTYLLSPDRGRDKAVGDPQMLR